ncbi:MAG: anthranilate phosphoribosyltransferase [Crocinitomicaceae bacterium]|nr:anthranilate phosphoribosyltransferase [Crocinitomicaceae bacterium]
MNYLLDKIIAHEHLNFQEAKDFIYGIEEEEFTKETISGILVGIQMRGIQLEELKGFRSALLELCLPTNINATDAIDLCGTGGDGKNTFNISTTTALVLAGMGKKVVKHGNYGVSSLCGSSNVLEELGVRFTNNSDDLQSQLDKNNICFLHAPLFHPTMKKVAPIRKGLGVRTIFNCLGPLVNPAQPGYQLTGTYSLELAKIYQHILKEERTNFNIAYAMDGYDEITLTDSARVLGKNSDTIVNAPTFNASVIEAKNIVAGTTIRSAAKIIVNLLEGKGTNEQNSVVAANTALALKQYHPETTIDELYSEAMTAIESGSLHQTLNFTK